MRSKAGIALRGAGVGLVAGMLTGGCTTMEPPGSRYSPPAAGTSLLRVERNTGSFGKGTREISVTVTEDVWNGKEVIAFKSPSGSTIVSREGRLLAMLDRNAKAILTWDPPEGSIGFRFPLQVGNTWTESSRMTTAANKVIPHESACRVEAEEDVTVPAGTFRTFKVHCTSPRGHEMTQWYAPEPGLTVKQVQVRSASNPFGGAGSREEEIVSLKLQR